MDRIRFALRNNLIFGVEALIGIVVIMAVFMWDRPWSSVRLSEKQVTSIGIVVAAWVGLLTLHTLRHSIAISRNALRPLLIVRVVRIDGLTYDRLPRFRLEVVNQGSGPALNVVMQESALKLQFTSTSIEDLLQTTSLGPGDLLDIDFEINESAPFRMYSLQFMSKELAEALEGRSRVIKHREAARLSGDFTQHEQSGHRLKIVEDQIRDELQATIVAANPIVSLTVFYSDIYERWWRTVATITARQSALEFWPSVTARTEGIYAHDPVIRRRVISFLTMIEGSQHKSPF